MSYEIIPIISIYIALGFSYMVFGEGTNKIFSKDKIKIKRDWYKKLTYLDLIMFMLFLPITIFVFVFFAILYIGAKIYTRLNVNIFKE